MDEDIISGIKVGDSSFFNDAYFRYHQQIYQFIFKKTQSDYIATEVVQLCFIRLWEKRNALSETNRTECAAIWHGTYRIFKG